MQVLIYQDFAEAIHRVIQGWNDGQRPLFEVSHCMVFLQFNKMKFCKRFRGRFKALACYHDKIHSSDWFSFIRSYVLARLSYSIRFVIFLELRGITPIMMTYSDYWHWCFFAQQRFFVVATCVILPYIPDGADKGWNQLPGGSGCSLGALNSVAGLASRYIEGE